MRHPDGSNNNWSERYEIMQRLKYDDTWYPHEPLFSHRECPVAYNRKKKQYKKDHYPSCWFIVIFNTPKHQQLVDERDARIRDYDKQLRDETLQKISFDIPG